MEPIRKTRIAIQFASQLSPWWLLVLVPVVLLLAWRLYRNQWRDISRRHALCLLGLRCVLLAAVVILIFRPSLILREILTYPGRVLLVIDDSDSMIARDPGYSDVEALRLARWLGRAGEPPAPAHELADVVADLESRMRRFGAWSLKADRSRDAFWERAERVQTRALQSFNELDRGAVALRDLDADQTRRLKDVQDRLAGLRAELPAFFTGGKSPGARAFAQYCARLREAESRLLDLQAALDRQALDAGDAERRRVIADVRARTRLELLTDTLQRTRPALHESLPNQYLRFVRLTSGERGDLAALATDKLAGAGGPTDLLGRLHELAAEESDFPLTAVVLLSDGRELSGGSPAALTRALARRQVPVFAGAVGSVREPTDLAVLDVVAPPFAVKGAPMNVRVHLKTALPAPADVKVEAVRGGNVVASEAVRIGERDEQTVVLRVLPADVGRFRWTARVTPAPGEIFPHRNNAADFAPHVRADKVRVLLLDWKPRWETRFALNILQRLDYIELNSIIVLAEENSTLRRGVQKGAWPQDLATLRMYDLVVLGALPPDLLTPAEWAMLRTYVEDRGGTVCFIGDGRACTIPGAAGLREALLPVRPRDAKTPVIGEALDRICLAAAGRYHPVTTALARGLPVAALDGAARLRPGTQCLLLAAPGGQPLVTARLSGKGKTLLIDTDLLWRRLNPTLLSAHAAMFIQLVTWAVDARTEAGLLLDRYQVAASEGLQVWDTRPEGALPMAIDAVAGGEVVAQSKTARLRPGATLARAVFERPPVRDLAFRLSGAEQQSAPVVVIDDNPELHRLAQDETFLRALAEGTGGEYASFGRIEQFFDRIQARQRVEKRERVWQLWDSGVILGLVFFVLVLEWIWRKLVGLV